MGSETPVWKAYGAGIKCTVCVLTQQILSFNDQLLDDQGGEVLDLSLHSS